MTLLTTRWDDLLPVADAAKLVGVRPATIRSWVNRGHLAARGLDERNRPLYHADDVIEAEHRVRSNALRTSGVDPRVTRGKAGLAA